MGGLLAVLPVIDTKTADICVPSILHPSSASGLDPGEILIVDNTREGLAGRYPIRTYRDPDGHNLGVARAWNIAAREVLENDIDYLLIMSASLEFGPILNCTWKWQMEQHWGEHVIEADGHSWHLIAFHRRVLEAVGIFDENFYPAYFEAIDFGYRMRQVDMEGAWTRKWVNVLSRGVAMHAPMISCPAPPLLEYYRQKWGGDKGEERWTQPWGNKPLDYFPDASIPQLARKYGLEVWW